jgi:hypothetical protein
LDRRRWRVPSPRATLDVGLDVGLGAAAIILPPGVVTTAFAGTVPVSGIVLGSGAPPQSVSSSQRPGYVGGSFVNIGPSGSGVVPPPAATSVDPSPAGRGSRSDTLGSRPDAGGAPTIDWGSERSGALDHLTSSKDSQDWLDDFLNHLGQNEMQRNPNAGIRVVI